MERIDTRQGFLISALAHLGIIMLVASRPATAPKTARNPEEAPPVAQRVFLPPASVLRQLAPIPPRPAAPAPRPPAPVPTPPPEGKDRISVGPPVEARQKGPMILRREDDLTKVAKGRPDAIPSAPPPAPPVAPPDAGKTAGVDVTGKPGLRLPPGLGDMPRGTEGSPGKPGEARPSIANSLRNLDQRIRSTGPLGLESGTGQQMGPLFFDPRGADFTAWLNQFKNEVYRNWIAPQPFLMGFRGHVDIEFTVLRDGSLTNMKVLKSTGTPALDRAAQNALLGSRFLGLPSDFSPASVTMQVTFFYNEGPTGS